MIPALPIIALLAGGTAVFVARRKLKPKMTAERKAVYETALKTLKDPAKLRELAESFRQEGLAAQAELLEKRAALRELPKAVKEARKEIFRQAMASKDRAGVLAMADAYDREGATGAADALRDYAKGLS